MDVQFRYAGSFLLLENIASALKIPPPKYVQQLARRGMRPSQLCAWFSLVQHGAPAEDGAQDAGHLLLEFCLLQSNYKEKES